VSNLFITIIIYSYENQRKTLPGNLEVHNDLSALMNGSTSARLMNPTTNSLKLRLKLSKLSTSVPGSISWYPGNVRYSSRDRTSNCRGRTERKSTDFPLFVANTDILL